MTELTGFRKRLHDPGPLYWSIAVVPEPATASILGYSGVDYVMLDAEHAPYTLASLHACVTALKNTPASVIVRTSSADPIELAQMVDLGADGVLAPHIETAEEAAAVVRAVRFPPEGGRGIGEGMLSTRYGLDEDVFVGRSNAAIAAMVILESKRAIENAAEIAAVPGLDAIFVGSADLSGDLGVPGEYGHPDVLAGVDAAVEQALAAGLKVFALATPRTAAERDAGLVYCATDAIALTAAARSALEGARTAWNQEVVE